MKVFRDQQIQDFQKGRVRDLAGHFPKRCAELGESGITALVKAGVTKSFSLGVVGEEDVENIINLMMLYGEAFDTREEFAYEAEPLRDNDLPADARVSVTLARFGLKPGFGED